MINLYQQAIQSQYSCWWLVFFSYLNACACICMGQCFPFNLWRTTFNPLNAELNPICCLLALLAHHFLHVSRIRVKSLTLRLLMSYIYMEHPFLMFLDHTRRRTTVGRTPLDEWSVRRRDLYLWPVAARLLRSWVRIPPGTWIFVCCECRVLSGGGLCAELITRPEESYRLSCVVVCDLETSRMGAPYVYDISSLRVNRFNPYPANVEKMVSS